MAPITRSNKKQTTLDNVVVTKEDVGEKRPAPAEHESTNGIEEQLKPKKARGAKDADVKDASGLDSLDKESENAKNEGKALQADKNIQQPVPTTGTLECGHIYFWYKPKVEVDHPDSLDDVSKCHVLLLPNPSGTDETHYRLLTFGRKHLPVSKDEGGRETEWGQILAVGDDLKELQDALGSSTYETKTRGTRHQPASRCAGYGHYALHSPKNSDPTPKTVPGRTKHYPIYLCYALSMPLPQNFGDVQESLDIKPTGSFAVQVKNPDAPSTNPRAPTVPKERQNAYPPELRALFATRFIPANPVALLDYSGQELLFISGKSQLPDDAGQKVKDPVKEDQEEVEAEEKRKDNQDVIFDEVFDELGIFEDKNDVPGIRALEGLWA